MEKSQEIIQAKIKELEAIIKRNKFINDMAWFERAEQNIECQKEIDKLQKLL